jgi:hypothetical protein
MINLRFGCEQGGFHDCCNSGKRTDPAIRRNLGAVGMGAASLGQDGFRKRANRGLGTFSTGGTYSSLAGHTVLHAVGYPTRNPS